MPRPFSGFTNRALPCRIPSIRHKWDDIPLDIEPESWRSHISGTRLCFRCEQCGSKKYEIWSPVTGNKLGVLYEYTEAYKLSKDMYDEYGGMKGLHDQARIEYLGRKAGKRKVVTARKS
jgi:hypothetical protein